MTVAEIDSSNNPHVRDGLSTGENVLVDTPPLSDIETNKDVGVSPPGEGAENGAALKPAAEPDVFSENCFFVKIAAPGIEPFDLQVSIIFYSHRSVAIHCCFRRYTCSAWSYY